MLPVAAGSCICESIQRGEIDQVYQLLQQDRGLLKQKYWGGFTGLHFAALHGNQPMAELLLNNGADPNIPCDAGQTPFHFACRNGNVYIMHKMMQHGADIKIVDEQGKTSLLHAVSGGSVIAMQYLWETGMFSFSDADYYQVTPLHLAASTGNTDVVRYLLREHRCTSEAVDHKGATALHVAAEKGMTETSATLQDVDAIQQTTKGSDTQRLICDVLLDADVAISQWGSGSHYSCSSGGIWRHLLCAAVSLYGQSPPLTVPQTEQFSENPGQLIKAETDTRFSSIGDLLEANESPYRFCIYCELIQVDNCKHCRLCDVCIKEYDHHCLFFNQCVGRDNHRLFILYIMSQVVAHLIFIFSAGCYLLLKLSVLQRPDWGLVVAREAWVLLLTLLNILSLIWVSWLLGEQLDAISLGTTTYFRYNHKRPSKRQRLATVISFLLEGRKIQRDCQSFNV